MWWGDARVQAKVTAFAFGDVSVFERGIRLMARSQGPDGSLHSHPPADIPGHRLPDFMLTWVCSLLDYHQYTGRSSLLKEMMPTVNRLLEFFGSTRDSGWPDWRFRRLVGLSRLAAAV